MRYNDGLLLSSNGDAKERKNALPILLLTNRLETVTYPTDEPQRMEYVGMHCDTVTQ